MRVTPHIMSHQFLTSDGQVTDCRCDSNLLILSEHDSAELAIRRFLLKLALSILFATIAGPIIRVWLLTHYMYLLPKAPMVCIYKNDAQQKVLAPEVLTILINLVEISKSH